MKHLSIFILLCLLSSCSNVLDKPLNPEDLQEVKVKISDDPNYSDEKKKYLVEQVTMQTGFGALGEAIGNTNLDIPTFRQSIDELSAKYDSAIENNATLDRFLELRDANAAAIDKYNGYLNFTVKFNNGFEKDILYIVLNYKYIDQYDTEYFNKSSKVTDKVAKNFLDKADLGIRAEYDKVAEFLYTKVPTDEEKMKEYLMEGLKLETEAIVFTDKSEINRVRL